MKPKSKKTKPAAATAPASPPASRSRRRTAPVVVPAKEGRPHSGPTPAQRRKASSVAGSPVVGALPPVTPVQGAVRLELTGLNAVGLLAYVHTLIDGLTDNAYYTAMALSIEALRAKEKELISLIDSRNLLDQQSRSLSAVLEAELIATSDLIRNTARTCESADSSDEALLSAGWGLRRAPTPPQVLPAPIQLRVEKTPFSGEVRARWRVVTNSRCYEVQSLPVTDASRPALWESSTAGVSPRANHTFKDLPSGSFVSIRIRAVGAKGAGPWCDPIVARVP